jgi:DNA-binding response OmpR family regulator
MRPSPRASFSENSTVVPGKPIETWPTLLVVDDDEAMLQALVCYFERRGFHVAPAASLEEAKACFHRRRSWTLVISDFHLPDGTGNDLWAWVSSQSGPVPPFLLMSGSLEGELLCAGVDFLAKPFPLSELEARVRELLRMKQN